MTTDEGEINAATSTMSLILSSAFDLSETYFLLGGVAGISPTIAGLGSVTFARFSVQAALQYEIDAREKPLNFSTGYVPQGTTGTGQYPGFTYGTEVYELNDALRQRAIGFAKAAKLNDSASARAYRELYTGEASFKSALGSPSVIGCDVMTSDNWWSGELLAEAFEESIALFTNGTAKYCTTAQEDGAVLGALLRGAVSRLVDFSRIIVMRTASDFDRPPPNVSAADNLFNGQDAGYDPAIINIYRAGIKVVEGIVANWESTFKSGIEPQNYVGDNIGSLGGKPNYGLGSEFDGEPAPST
jgi:purine nucleoside permease